MSEGTIRRRGEVRRDKRIRVRDLRRTWEDYDERQLGRTSRSLQRLRLLFSFWREVIAGFLAKWDYLA